MKKEIIEKALILAQKAASENGVLIYDVEFVKEAGANYLRIFLDKEEGDITIDDCENVSRLLDTMLDEEDFIKESYYLEVSSIGLDRPLKKEKDFYHFMGSIIEVKLYKPINNKKHLVGKLISFDKNSFEIDVENEIIKINVKEASLIRPYIEF